MDWHAPHADYVITAYLVAGAIVLWCLLDTLAAYIQRRRK